MGFRRLRVTLYKCTYAAYLGCRSEGLLFDAIMQVPGETVALLFTGTEW